MSKLRVLAMCHLNVTLLINVYCDICIYSQCNNSYYGDAGTLHVNPSEINLGQFVEWDFKVPMFYYVVTCTESRQSQETRHRSRKQVQN